jgi:hypothetical protein
MTVSLIDIASDLAIQNPIASEQEIAEVIIDSIQSESVMAEAIARLVIPTKTQIKEAEFKSQRLPRKRGQKQERDRILEHIENARFFTKLKEFYAPSPLDATLTPNIELDGAHVVVPFPIENLVTASRKIGTKRWLNLNGTERIQKQSYKDVLMTQSLPLTLQSATRNNERTKISPNDIISEIEGNIESGDFLTFYDMYQLINVMEFSAKDNEIVIRIADIVHNEVTKRNRAFKANCINELYAGESFMPEECRVSRMKTTVLTNAIWENLNGIILNEYRRLHDKASHNFLNKEIDYEKYMQLINGWAFQANALFTELQ